ncbi:hypothetical protein BX616_002759, partial [Lobosporangium transversale]
TCPRHVIIKKTQPNPINNNIGGNSSGAKDDATKTLVAFTSASSVPRAKDIMKKLHPNDAAVAIQLMMRRRPRRGHDHLNITTAIPTECTEHLYVIQQLQALSFHLIVLSIIQCYQNGN